MTPAKPRNESKAPRHFAAGSVLLLLACGSLRPSDEQRVESERERTVAAPIISTPFPIVSPILAHRTGVPIVAAAAGSGTYLLVYHLARGIRDHRLIGVRVRASDGAILDTNGFLIATVDLQSSVVAARAAYTGDHWIVAYQADGFALQAVTVSSSGGVGTPTALGLAPTTPAALVWGGDRALLVTRSGQGLFLDAAGSALGNPATIFPGTSPTLEAGDAAFDGTSYLVQASTSFESPATVRLFSLQNGSTEVRSADAFSVARAGAVAANGSVVSDGTAFLVTYTASPPSCAGGGACTPLVPYYRTASVDGMGNVGLGTAAVLAQTMDPTDAVYTNGSYLLFNRGDVLRVASNGSALGPVQPLLNGVSNEFFAAISGSSFDLVPLGATELLATSGPLALRVSTALAPLDSPPLAPLELPRSQTSPAVAFDGANYLVAWLDAGRGGVRASRVSPAGTALDPGSIAVASGNLGSVTLASNGSGSLVGWLQDGDALRADKVTQGGSLVVVDDANLGALATAPAFASNGTDYLAAWLVPGSPPPATWAARIPETGDPPAPFPIPGPIALRLALAFDGQNYVVVQDAENGNRRQLRATRVSPALQVLDDPSDLLLDYAASVIDPAPVIASNGSGSLVVWFEGDSGGVTSTVRCTRLTQDLEVLDAGGIAIGTGAYPTKGAVAAWDGSSYWVLWEDRPSAITTRVRLLGRRLTSAAVAIDDQPFVVTTDLPDVAFVPDRLLGLARGPNGNLLLASLSDDPFRDGQTVQGRFLRSAGGSGGGGAGGGGAGAGTGGTGAGTGGAGAGAGAGVGGAGAGGAGAGGAGTGGAGAGGAGRGGSAGAAEGGEGGSGDEGGEGGGGESGGEAGAPTGGTSSGGRSTGGASQGGSSGSGGAGGRPSTGGRGGTTGGDDDAGGTGGSPPDDDSGCSCSVPARERSQSPLLLGALGLLALSVRRRASARTVRS